MDRPMDDLAEPRGPIAWMARNPVAANLLMAVLIVGGFIMAFNVKQEVFPEFDLDTVSITVPYPGASPAEVEQGILLAIEDEVRGIDGIKRVTSSAVEGSGAVQVELLLGADTGKALQDVKNAVDRITTFPQDAERPTVSLLTTRRQVVDIILYGDVSERELRQLGERARDELLQGTRITLVELRGIRPLEIAVETPQETLRAHGLTLEDIATEVRQAALELPGGGVKTAGGEVLLRLAERRDLGREFRNIPIVSRTDGTEVRLGEIAEVIDGFEDTDEAALFNGKPAVMLEVYRVGDQTPVEIAAVVNEYLDGLRKTLPPGVKAKTWLDNSQVYRQRMELLVKNGLWGLLLVLIILGVFLDVRLAFWVTMGIPVSFLGALLLMPALGVSINMISLFAFIMALGIVVDDAIVVGESVYEFRREGMPRTKAAVLGAKLVAVPVTFSVLTNMTSFGPMLFVPGTVGKIYRVIPSVVIPIFAISLIESLLILPAHLGHQRPPRKHGVLAFCGRVQQRVSDLIVLAVRAVYKPLVACALRGRYLTVAIALGTLIVAIGYARSGRIGFRFMPRVEGDFSTASIVLPYGVPVEETRRVQDRVREAVERVLARHGGEKITEGIYTRISGGVTGFSPLGAGRAGGGSHLATVQVLLVEGDKRDVGLEQVTNEWRREIGEIPGVEAITFSYTIGPSSDKTIDIQLRHRDVAVLERAASETAAALRTYPTVSDVDDGFSRGKPQLDFKVTPEARSLGITAAYLGRQVRNAFYGAEALRQQRGRDEVKVMVRLPASERKSEYDVEELILRVPQGGEIALGEAADVVRGHAYTEIERDGGSRVLDVTADVMPGAVTPGQILEDLGANVLPRILGKYPGLSYSLEGEEREQRESFRFLGIGFAIALIVIFAMLAVPLKSYIQPLVIMTAIPFGIIGALAGHIVMGYELSLISMLGIVALAGVVVNDSLVLVHATNARRREGKTAFDAVVSAGARRFRPIMLTSLTTFFGLAPLIFERSVQARFLVPMAISLGFGIVFSTLITLVLVPSLYLVVEDWRRLPGWIKGIIVGGAGGVAVGIATAVSTGRMGEPLMPVIIAGGLLGGAAVGALAALWFRREPDEIEPSGPEG